jgi:hypothetical protein
VFTTSSNIAAQPQTQIKDIQYVLIAPSDSKEHKGISPVVSSIMAPLIFDVFSIVIDRFEVPEHEYERSFNFLNFGGLRRYHVFTDHASFLLLVWKSTHA